MRRYGPNRRHPDGRPEDPTLCIVEIWIRSVIRQCSLPRGTDGLCTLHRHQKAAGAELVIPEETATKGGR